MFRPCHYTLFDLVKRGAVVLMLTHTHLRAYSEISLSLKPEGGGFLPTIFISAAADTFVYQRYPRNNYVDRAFMSAGRSECNRLGYMLLLFQPSQALPREASITNAELRLMVITAISTTPSTTYSLHRVQSRWSASTVTWNSMPMFDSTPVASFASPSLGLLSNNVTGLVSAWSSGERSQLGLLIKNSTTFNANTYIQSATVNARNSDNWPRLKIEFTLPAVSIGSITPQFANELVNMPVPASGTAEHEKDVSLYSLVTVLVTNLGPGAVDVYLELSPDGVNYVQEGAVTFIEANDTAALVSGIFARYVKVVAIDHAGQGASLDIFFQGQIG